MSQPARRLGVTADGMTRVRAVVSTLAEADGASNAERSLTDLIAKAAVEVEQHAGTTRMMRIRGLAQRGRAQESLKAASSGGASPRPRTLDVVR